MSKVSKLELKEAITDIMSRVNMGSLTTKKIRLMCEKKFNVDLTSRKQEIDDVVMDFINKRYGKKESSSEAEESGSSGSGSGSDSDCSDSECSYSSSEDESNKDKAVAPKKSPAKSAKPPTSKQKVEPVQRPVPAKGKAKASNVAAKKRKASTASKSAAAAKKSPAKKPAATPKQAELDDADFARKLQAEEWNFRRQTVKKLFRNTPVKKVDKSDQAKKKKANPFMKKCLLSPALAEVLGTDEMSRPDVVQKMWSVVRERNLFDTSNKQYALCDEQLLKVFGKKRVRLIGMMKYLKHHIKDIR